MLEDRDYMRQPAYNEPSFSSWLRFPNWSWTLAIVVINVVVFLVECAFSPQPLRFTPDIPFCDQYMALSLDGIRHGYVWQLLTFQFMHGGFLHIFFNCWMIMVFGRILEDLLGRWTFLIIYLSSGVVGGLFQVSASILWPHWFPSYEGVIGASAGAFGLVAAFAALLPERELFLLLFFVIPLKLKAKTLLLGSALLALSGVLFPKSFFGGSMFGDHVANAAHLGGMFAGWLYVLTLVKNKGFVDSGEGEITAPRPPVLPSAIPSTFWRTKAVKSESELTPDEILRTQVDPILDKISAHGLHSLTQREREILEKASSKLAKR
jgi:membrane associated rhomboid family serine protease